MKKLLLSLGALSAVVAPVAAVVACGSSNEIGIERGDLINAINHSGLTPDQVTEYLAKAKNAKSTSEISKIHAKVDEMFNANSKDNSQWSSDRGTADGTIETFSYLTEEQRKSYKARIDAATSKEDIDKIRDEASAKNDESKDQANFEKWGKSFIGGLNKEFYLAEDWEFGTNAILTAKTQDGYNAAKSNLVAKKTNPKIAKAVSGAVIINAGSESKDGMKLYLPNYNVGTSTTWVDTSVETNQKTVRYTVVKGDSLTGKHIQAEEIKFDSKGKETKNIVDDSVSMDTVDDSDLGLHLSDMSGDYYVNGVKDSKDFIKNGVILDFFTKALHFLALKDGTKGDINSLNGMDAFLSVAFPTEDLDSISFDGKTIVIWKK